MRNKNLWIILAAVLVIALVALLAAVVQPPAEISGESITLPETTGGAEPQAYLLVTIGGTTYQPIGLHTEGEFTLTQADDVVNVVHVTPTSVNMAASTCDNQDCVLQGTVSLANRNDRVLQNMILCLPNEVVLSLYTEEEVAELLLNMAGYTMEDADE